MRIDSDSNNVNENFENHNENSQISSKHVANKKKWNILRTTACYWDFKKIDFNSSVSSAYNAIYLYLSVLT